LQRVRRRERTNKDHDTEQRLTFGGVDDLVRRRAERRSRRVAARSSLVEVEQAKRPSPEGFSFREKSGGGRTRMDY
jgi:hypothetical protein